jgi:lysylphosphatidylglycerol synthetase-like protein (DUF2156 family)
MTLLQEHIKKGSDAYFGVQDYVADVVARFPQIPESEWGHRKEVKCLWQLRYASRTNTVFTILLLPLMMLAGHAAARLTEVSFVTYHYLSPSDLSRFKRHQTLKKYLLPLSIMGILGCGMITVIAFVMVVVSIYPPAPLPGEVNKPIPFYTVALVFLFALMLVTAAIKVQRRVWKLGEPQDSDCFRDQRIQLRSFAIAR